MRNMTVMRASCSKLNQSLGVDRPWMQGYLLSKFREVDLLNFHLPARLWQSCADRIATDGEENKLSKTSLGKSFVRIHNSELNY